MDLLPRPKLHEIAGHACFKIKGILALYMALGRSIEFTVVPHPEFQRNERPLRIMDKIHCSEAMDELLRLMQTVHETNTAMDASYLGFFTTWHDTFLRSDVKHRLNNVWLYIINFTGSRYAKTSAG